MSNKRFNPAKLDKLNNPERLKMLPLEYIIEKSAIHNPNNIIDLGAGTGLFSAALAEKFKSCKIYATDISKTMIDWIKENRVHDYPNLHPLLMIDSKIDLEAEIADFLIMVNLHHELDSPIDTLKESYRLLKTGGKIAISDWKKEKTEMGPDISIRVFANEIENQLIKSGFKDVQIHNDLKFNYFVVAEK